MSDAIENYVAEVSRNRDTSATGHPKIGPTCQTCQTIHESGAVVAVGRFSPAGTIGYRARPDGPLRESRAEAMADACATRCVIPPGSDGAA